MTKTLITNNKLCYGVVLDECKNGNFEKTLDYVTIDLKGHLNTNIALKVLINCCNACISCNSNISEQYLLKLLKSLLPYIKDLSESEIVSYVQCLFHITKFLIGKGKLNLVVEMEDIIIPNFLPTQLLKAPTEVYHNLAKVLTNVTVKAAAEERNNRIDESNELFKTETDNRSYELFRISILMLKICFNFLDFTVASHLSVICLTNLCHIKLPLKYQIGFYKELLNLSANNRREHQEQPAQLIIVHSFSCVLLSNIISTYDFDKALEFLNTTSHQLKDICNCVECSDLQQVLKFFLIISPLKLAHKKSELDLCARSLKNLNVAREKLEKNKTFTHYLCKLLLTLKDHVYFKELLLIPEDMQLQIFKLIIEFSLLISMKTPSEVCEDIYGAFCGAEVVMFLMYKVAQNNENSSVYHKECVDILGKFLSNVEMMKSHNFEKWKKCWTHSATNLYNIGLALHKKSNQAAEYFNLLFQFVLRLESRDSPLVLTYSTLLESCKAVVAIHTKDIKKCQAFTALSILLCVNNRDTFASKWVTNKYNLKGKSENHLQKLTFVSALEEIPQVHLTVAEKVFLLTLELDKYKKIWKSKVPIVAAIKELLGIVENEYIVNVIVKLFIDMDLPISEDFYTILADVLDVYKHIQSKTLIYKVNLAILYYLQYKICNRKMISENEAQMERAASVQPIENDSESNDQDEKCDIFSSFDGLKLSEYLENLKSLQQSLDVFASLVPHLKTDNIEHVTFLQLYNLLLNISSEYKLLCFKLKSVKALKLALKIAQLRDDTASIIQTIGLIIEQEGLKNESMQTLMKTADALMEDKNFSKIDNLELSIMYYICKSRALLFIDYKESYEVFNNGRDLLRHAKQNDFRIIRSQLLLLNSQFCLLPCNLKVENHKKSLLMNAYSATEMMYEEYEQDRLGEPLTLSALIQANKEVVKLYHYLKCPREVRMYAKEMLTLSQKLLLPIHAASYLMYLAHADLLWDDKFDCHVKVNDMGAILCCQGELHKGSEAFGYSKQNSPSSPSMPVPSFQLPNAVRHENTCDCFYCVSSEYQSLVLEQIRISALLNVKENNLNVAQGFFQGALNLYNLYAQKQKENKKFVSDFLPSYGYILLNYSSHLWRTNHKYEAKQFNNTLLDLLSVMKLQYIHLYHEALVQKLGYLTDNIAVDQHSELYDEMDKLQIHDETELSKTPENKQSVISVFVEPSEFTSLRKIKKRLPFTFSPTETVISNNTKTRKQVDKTPVPAIQIYTEESTRRTKKKSVSNLLQIKQPLQPDFDNPPTSTSSTNGALKPRTKLLTEKLKKKIEPSVSDIENKVQAGAVGSKNPARKKLLKELSVPSTELKPSDNGAVRKSARNKK